MKGVSSTTWAGMGPETPEAFLNWESDNVLWFSERVGASNGLGLLVDKTCDFGQTWSGAVNATLQANIGQFWGPMVKKPDRAYRMMEPAEYIQPK